MGRLKRLLNPVCLLAWQVRLLVWPVLFDRTYYATKNLGRGRRPWDWFHFLFIGSRRGMDPHPCFHSLYYQSQLPAPTKNPYFHYHLQGQFQGISPCPTFDEKFYTRRASEKFTLPYGLPPLVHYLLKGSKAGIPASPIFSGQEYWELNPDVRRLGAEPLTHFMSTGRLELRQWTGLVSAQSQLRDLMKANPVLATELTAAWYPVAADTHQYSSQFTGRVQSLYEFVRRGGGEILREFPPEEVTIEPPPLIGSIRRESPGKTVSLPPPYVAKLSDGAVIGTCRLILTRAGEMLYDELDRDKDQTYAPKPVFLTCVSDGKTSQVTLRYTKRNGDEIAKGILLSADHDANYFHWLLEVMPKVLLVEAAQIPEDVPFLIRAKLHPNLKEALQTLAPNRRIIELDHGYLYQVKELYYPSDLSQVLDRYSGDPEVEDCLLSKKWISLMTARLLRQLNLPATRPTRKIYLTRRGAAYRKPTNEAQIEEYLLERGFEIVEITGASLRQQALLFSQAKVVIAPTGAACTNIAFSGAHCPWMVLSGNHPASNFYLFSQLAQIFSVPFTYLLCDNLPNMGPKFGVHDDYHVDIVELEGWLDRLGSGRGVDGSVEPAPRFPLEEPRLDPHQEIRSPQ